VSKKKKKSKKKSADEYKGNIIGVRNILKCIVTSLDAMIDEEVESD